MNKGTFFSALTEIDDDLITDFAPEKGCPGRTDDGGGMIGKRIRFLGPVAACVCVALLAGIVIMRPAEPQGPAGKDGSISSSAVMLPPDILRELADSDTVLRGEVLEVLGEEHANPDGTLINKRGDHIPLSLVTKYRFRVDEVYRSRDDISVGDVITVATVYDVCVKEEYLDKIEVQSEIPPYYLHEGQNGIFFFVSADSLVEEGEDDLLTLRSSSAAFDTVDENGIYHSKTYDLDPADLPEMYVEAEEKWGYLND
ncbi:MAG: hypothetical protein IKI91_03020 [Clostridia bacterium]|nr:hypothetical protein [Clostridia bacterium]